MTIVVNVEDSPLEQVTKQLNKLVEVIKIVELDGGASVVARAAAGQGQGRRRRCRGQVLEVVQLFRAKVVDVATDAVTVQVVGNTDKLADFLRDRGALRGPRARAVRDGGDRPRRSRSISERTLRPGRRARPHRRPAEPRAACRAPPQTTDLKQPNQKESQTSG